MRPVPYIPSLNPMDYFRQYGGLMITLCILLVSTSWSRAQSSSLLGNITIEKGGKVWIEGSAGMINYQCNAEKFSGAGEIENTTNPRTTVEGHGTVQISVALPVKSLDCGKRPMNKDMYNALKSDVYPTIRYQLLNATLAEEAGNNTTTSSWMNIRTRGIMEIAGVEDTTTIFVQGKVLSDDRFQVKGSKPIHMDTYNIDPPSAMFGLIRADEQLTVHFDVTVNLKTQGR